MSTLREARWLVGRARRSVREGTTHLPARAAAWRRFLESRRRYEELGGSAPLELLYPVLGEDTAETAVEPIYFFQDAWAFRLVAAAAPKRHVDVGSHHKFVSLLATIVPTTMVDIRALPYDLEGLTFQTGSVLELPFESGSVESVSSLCVVEHIGLGRYGDRLDPSGSERALAELTRIVAPGGSLYVSVPVEPESRTYFNAHRSFAESELVRMLEPLTIVERRYIYGSAMLEERRDEAGVGCYRARRL